jgi:hypothetical protein
VDSSAGRCFVGSHDACEGKRTRVRNRRGAGGESGPRLRIKSVEMITARDRCMNKLDRLHMIDVPVY